VFFNKIAVGRVKKVVRVKGFEPLTAWFVARYSIQLSYTRIDVNIENNI
jgi:hypothetical protein